MESKSDNINAELVIRIHADGSDNELVKGVFILYPGNKYIEDEKMLKSSKTAAEMVLGGIISSTHAASRGIVK